MLEELTKPRIGKLRIRGSVSDEPDVRLRLSRIFNRIEFDSGQINPSEIMVVKNLDDPLPGKLPVKTGRYRLINDWQKAVQAQIKQLRKNAVRPTNGHLLDHSNAVIFKDISELISCLALDLITDNVRKHWWWNQLLKNFSMSTNLSHMLCSILSYDIHQLPSILESLYTWKSANEVLQAIEPVDASLLTITLARAFGQSNLVAILNSSSPLTGGAKSVNGKANNSAVTNLTSISTSTEGISTYSVIEPVLHRIFWRQHLNDTPIAASIGRERSFLIGLGLIFHRKPWLVTSDVFQKQLNSLWNSSEYEHSIHTNSNEQGHRYELPSERNKNTDNKSNDQSDTSKITADISCQSKPEIPSKSGSKDLPTTAEGVKSIRSNDSLIEKQILDTDNSGSSLLESQELTKITIDKKSISPSQKRSDADSVLTEEAPMADSVSISSAKSNLKSHHDEISHLDGNHRIATNIGGVLYLLNLMKFLDIPACFERDWQLASHVSPWVILELFGRILLNDSSGAYQQDPLWGSLAKLDGRGPRETLAALYSGTDCYRLPRVWYKLMQSSRDTFRWSTDQERLHIWSSSGIFLINVPFNENADLKQVELEIKPYLADGQPVLFSKTDHIYSPLNSDISIHGTTVSAGLQSWLNNVMPAIRCRMIQILGNDLFYQLLKLPAKIYFSSCHIDMVTSMDNISMIARISGLDQNPGWMPVIGKVVTFHFE